MTVQEALEHCGIKKLKPKYKSVMNHERYGEILATDKKFPRPIERFDAFRGNEMHYFDQALFDKIQRRTFDSFESAFPGSRTGKFFSENHTFYGVREPGWNEEDARAYLIMEDFVRTFYGQETLDRMAEDHKIEDWRIRQGGGITVYFNAETRLTLLCGQYDAIPLCMFIAPTDIPNSI